MNDTYDNDLVDKARAEVLEDGVIHMDTAARMSERGMDVFTIETQLQMELTEEDTEA